jgi:hypothetical protein
MAEISEFLDLSMEIQLEARDLPNLDFGSLSDPFAVIDVRNDGEWLEFGMFPAFMQRVALLETSANARNVQVRSMSECANG